MESAIFEVELATKAQAGGHGRLLAWALWQAKVSQGMIFEIP